MKLLSWVHRKLRREAAAPGDPHRDLAGGGHPCICLSSQPSLEKLHQHHQHHPISLLTMPSLHWLFVNDTCPEAAPEEYHPPAREELLFQGLLTIGTLGLGPSLEGLPPLQLLRLFDSIVAEKEQPEATESNMKRSDAELEEAFVLETSDKSGQLSSARASYASLSSGELFTKCQKAEEGGGGGGGGGKKGERGIAGMVRKMLKRRGSKAGAAASGGAAAAPSAGGHQEVTSTAETKFHKVLNMFHKKVHPEGSISQKKHTKSPKCDTHASAAYPSRRGGGEARVFSARAPKKDATSSCFRCLPHPPAPPGHSSLCRGHTNGTREQWIKTDMDYLVLEL